MGDTTHQQGSGLRCRDLLVTSIGVIVAQVGMVALMQGIGIGGWGFVLALLVAFGLAMSNALAFAELALMLPRTAGFNGLVSAALGCFPAILFVFAGYVAPVIFGLPAELILADQILTRTVPLGLPPFTWPVLLIVVFALLNILGTDVFAKVQTALCVIVLCFLLATSLTVLSGHAAAPNPAAGLAQMREGIEVLGVVALAFWVFVGSEFVVPLAGEARNARRDLPRAMVLGLLLIFVAQLLFCLGAATLMPREALPASPTPHLDYAVAAFGQGANAWFAGLALVASASLVNTVLASVPRMLCAMADEGLAFKVFAWRHPRFGTPVVAILFVALLPMIGLLWSGGDPQAILPLTIAASVAWLLAYVTMQCSLVVLRQRHPAMPRPFKAPGYPVVPALSIAGMVYVVLNCSPAPEMTGQIARYTGIVLALFSVVAFVWVRYVMRRPLFAPTHTRKR